MLDQVSPKFGTSRDNTVESSILEDFTFGFGGDDTIYGCQGNDDTQGGIGNDTLTGGACIHNFLFSAISVSDNIIDFKLCTDIIDLSLLSEVIAFSDLTITDQEDDLGVTITHATLGGTNKCKSRKLSNKEWMPEIDQQVDVAKIKEGLSVFLASRNTPSLSTSARWWHPSCIPLTRAIPRLSRARK
ncbi:MAG: hypothetical protein OXL41_15150 [Nitrospinae bacterium]|nr:hypothetical protein [Nitrospinota bacterium]